MEMEALVLSQFLIPSIRCGSLDPAFVARGRERGMERESEGGIKTVEMSLSQMA